MTNAPNVRKTSKEVDLGYALACCAKLIGTKRIEKWESDFLVHAVALADERGADALTYNQKECINRIYREKCR